MGHLTTPRAHAGTSQSRPQAQEPLQVGRVRVHHRRLRRAGTTGHARPRWAASTCTTSTGAGLAWARGQRGHATVVCLVERRRYVGTVPGEGAAVDVGDHGKRRRPQRGDLGVRAARQCDIHVFMVDVQPQGDWCGGGHM